MSEQQKPRWYCVAKNGATTLCDNKEDAEEEAKAGDAVWPQLAPHRAVQLVEAAEVERLQAEIDALRKQLETIKSGWIRALDEEMVTTHLGVANESDNYADAKRKLNSLICWHIDVATDWADDDEFAE